MAFRKFGGIEYNRKNNYVSSNINNNMNLNITDQIGNINTKIVTKSHLDLDGQTMFNVGNVIFANGLDIEQLLGNVDLSNTAAIQSIFTSNNSWSGANTFNNTTVMSSATMTNASASNLLVGACQININGDIDASSLSVGSISGGAISGSSLDINGYGISSAGTITGNTLTISGTTGTIGGIPILTTVGLSGYASLTDTGSQSFAGNISTPSLSSGSIGITGTSYGISSTGAISGSSLGINGYGISSTGTITGNSISGSSLGIEGATYGISSSGVISGSNIIITGPPTSTSINGENIITAGTINNYTPKTFFTTGSASFSQGLNILTLTFAGGTANYFSNTTYGNDYDPTNNGGVLVNINIPTDTSPNLPITLSNYSYVPCFSNPMISGGSPGDTNSEGWVIGAIYLYFNAAVFVHYSLLFYNNY